MTRNEFAIAVQDQLNRYEALLDLLDSFPSQGMSFSRDPHYVYTLVKDASRFGAQLERDICPNNIP